jgi:CBS domain-containing protein
MGQAIRDIMTPDPVSLDKSASVREAARQMRDQSIGDILVTERGRLCGIVTDRDLVVRYVAEDVSPDDAKLDEFCTKDMVTLKPDSDVGEAIELMEKHAVRRLPVVEKDRPIGIVSLGDLAVARDRDSALGKISAAPPQQ